MKCLSWDEVTAHSAWANFSQLPAQRIQCRNSLRDACSKGMVGGSSFSASATLGFIADFFLPWATECFRELPKRQLNKMALVLQIPFHCCLSLPSDAASVPAHFWQGCLSKLCLSYASVRNLAWWRRWKRSNFFRRKQTRFTRWWQTLALQVTSQTAVANSCSQSKLNSVWGPDCLYASLESDVGLPASG